LVDIGSTGHLDNFDLNLPGTNKPFTNLSNDVGSFNMKPELGVYLLISYPEKGLTIFNTWKKKSESSFIRCDTNTTAGIGAIVVYI